MILKKYFQHYELFHNLTIAELKIKYKFWQEILIKILLLKNVNYSMDNGAIGFFLFFVILIIIWIFAMGGCVRERNSLGVYEGITSKKSNRLSSSGVVSCLY